MNTSNKLCRYTVAAIYGIRFILILLILGVAVKSVEAGNQIPESFDNVGSVQTNVKLVLVGTVLSGAGKSIAIFEDNKTNAQQFHRLGDTIEDGRIIKILKDRVFLSKNDVEVELKIGYGIGSTFVQDQTQVDDNVGVDQSVTTNMLQPMTGDTDMSELDINVSQIYEGGAEVLDIEEDGILSKLGLRPGDIIRNINHRNTDADLSFSEAVVQDIRSGNNMLRLELERDGEEKVIYNVLGENPLPE